MTLGFTGTQHGMTNQQQLLIYSLFRDFSLKVLHHGDCVGADAQAHVIASRMGVEIVVHPPINGKLRAFCDHSLPNTLLSAKPYLERNKDIVKAGVDGLIATPEEFEEQQRSGTWATIRCARKLGRRIWIVLPDGKLKEENRMEVS